MLSASLLSARGLPSTHRLRSWCDGSVVASSGLSSQAPRLMLKTKRCLMRLRAMSLMRAGDVVRCDFGTPSRGEPGFVRPAIIVTSNDVLEFRQHAIVVVPCTTTKRGWLSEVDIFGFGVSQAHLPTTISVDRIVDTTGTNIGPVALQQIREAHSRLDRTLNQASDVPDLPGCVAAGDTLGGGGTDP